MKTGKSSLHHQVRVVTATSLFDGHDAAINIMRRLIQAGGAEVIHLGHNRSVAEVVEAAIQEDVQAIAVSSYQGGHVEFFKYMRDMLVERGCGHIRIFGGGGGVIRPDEIKELQAYGIERIYDPEDGRVMGLMGMIDDLLKRSDFHTINVPGTDDASGKGAALPDPSKVSIGKPAEIARLITLAEMGVDVWKKAAAIINRKAARSKAPVIGVTGTGGAGKSSLIDELVFRLWRDNPEKAIAILSSDPSKRRTGGALLGDRIRMNSISNPHIYMRSLATRGSRTELPEVIKDAVAIIKAAGYDLIFVETPGIGQGDMEVTTVADTSLYVMTSEYGAATQLEKIDMLDYADIVVLNKFDKKGSEDALRDIRRQLRRSRNLFDAKPEDMPVYGIIVSKFNDEGVNTLYADLVDHLPERKFRKQRLNVGIARVCALQQPADVGRSQRSRHVELAQPKRASISAAMTS